MFTAELGEAVIGTDKEIVAADVMVIVKWWPMRRDGLSELPPLQLDGVLQLLPGKNGTVMNLSLVKLGWRAYKGCAGFAFPIALAVAVVEGYVSY